MLSTNIRLALIVRLSTSVSIGGSACGDIDSGEAPHGHRISPAVAWSEAAAFQGGRQIIGRPRNAGASGQQGRNPMIMSGGLLIERDALRPRCFEVEAGSHPNGWMFIKQTLTPQQLEKELSATGWTFFFMAGPIRAAAFGFNREKTVDAALNRGIQGVRRLRCNCLQIETVELRSFLGIPYVSMSVRPRHIQKGRLFASSPPGAHADVSAAELRRKPAAT
jgi:hypothetical protein